jgi:integrase
MSVIIKGKNPNKPHTVRYWVDGKQREKSFATAKEAKDFKVKTDHDTRAQIFVDDKLGRENFGAACETWLERRQVAERTLKLSWSAYRVHVKPAFGNMTLAQVASDRDAVCDLLQVKMRHLSITLRETVRQIITAVCTEAVRAGKITRHALDDIELRDDGHERTGFVFPEYSQVAAVADAVGIAVWLMRGCGVRIEEALAIHKGDFIHGGKTLRVSGQATLDGRRKVALKHRKVGEYRDAPVPSWLWEIVKDLPDGPLCPGNGRLYQVYGTVLGRFQRASAAAGIEAGFHPHSLRHAYVSTLLARGVPLTDIAPWVGHRDISKLYKVYGHLLPHAEGRALAALDGEFQEWSKTA